MRAVNQKLNILLEWPNSELKLFTKLNYSVCLGNPQLDVGVNCAVIVKSVNDSECANMFMHALLL